MPQAAAAATCGSPPYWLVLVIPSRNVVVWEDLCRYSRDVLSAERALEHKVGARPAEHSMPAGPQRDTLADFIACAAAVVAAHIQRTKNALVSERLGAATAREVQMGDCESCNAADLGWKTAAGSAESRTKSRAGVPIDAISDDCCRCRTFEDDRVFESSGSCSLSPSSPRRRRSVRHCTMQMQQQHAPSSSMASSTALCWPMGATFAFACDAASRTPIGAAPPIGAIVIEEKAVTT